MLLVVAESNCPSSLSVTVDSVCIVSFPVPPLITGDPGPPPVLSEFCRLVVEEKFILPASPVSNGCRILLSRTCCNLSESLVLSPPNPNIRDFRRFST